MFLGLIGAYAGSMPILYSQELAASPKRNVATIIGLVVLCLVILTCITYRILGGYEQLKGSGTILMDNNRELFLLDLINWQVRKVGQLPKALEESNITCLPVLWNGYVHFLSGMELVQISIDSYDATFTKVANLYFRSKLKFLWIVERLKRGRKPGRLTSVPWALIREVTRYLTAYAPN